MRRVDCPSCNESTRVLESRPADEGQAVRRRRECTICARRFTTVERRRPEPVWVLKRDGSRQRFDQAKLAGGLARAAHKRPVEREAIMRLAAAIEEAGEREGGELGAERIGELSLEGLRELDRVAYLQFAAVYRGFEDPSEFTDELARLGVDPPGETNSRRQNRGGRGPKLGDPESSDSVRAEEQSWQPARTGRNVNEERF